MKSSPTSRNSMPMCSGAVPLWTAVSSSTEMGRVQMRMRVMLARRVHRHIGHRDRRAAIAVEQRVQQDGAKGRGADAAHREAAELEREVAGAQHQRDGGDDQVLVLRKVHAV